MAGAAVTTTLRDVARLAGVSISTASRALNDDHTRPVAPETSARVWEVARRLNYEPNIAAQRLVRRVDSQVHRTGSLGLILGEANKFSDPFWSRVLDGVAEELIRQEYHLRFALTVQDLERQSQHVLHDVDGLILLGGVQLLGADTLPRQIVMIEGADDQGRWNEQLPADVISLEKRRAIYHLVDHLVALGHRRLAFLGPAPTVDERAEAYIHALARHDLPFDPARFMRTSWSAEGGYQVAKALFAGGSRPDALVCACDTIAIGAMRAAKEHGLRLPDDLAITGFDDISFARDLDPPLTTIHVPKELLGELTVRRLVERIGHPERPYTIEVVRTSLVVRGSCGAARGHAAPPKE
jgi:DNA-binding LacI/PurR family transcriptional regulator